MYFPKLKGSVSCASKRLVPSEVGLPEKHPSFQIFYFVSAPWTIYWIPQASSVPTVRYVMIMGNASMRLGIAYCLILQMVLTILLPCPCLLAGDNGFDVSLTAGNEAASGTNAKPICWCSARQIMQPTTQRIHSTWIAKDALVVPSLPSTASCETDFSLSLDVSRSDVVAAPDIHDIQILRE